MAQNWDFTGMLLVFVSAIVFTNFLIKAKFGSLFFIIGSLIGAIGLIAGIYFFLTKK
ncbi:MAG: hypothetical protein QW757_03410 [Candidatus Woesearchaeota archaeon]